ncbi:MAG: OmpA family protein [Flavobacteriales bacterium]|nr:OmpA family protein [Flavobacteriales bacterium]
MRLFLSMISFFLVSVLAGQTFDLNSKNLHVDETFVLPSPLFHFNKYEIRSEMYSFLDSIAAFLHKHDSVKIEIATHTDSRYSEYYSMRLDQRRSESIRDYLIMKGIERERLKAQGYGKMKVLIPDSEIEKMGTDEEKEKAHAINRRTELIILSLGDE